MNFRTLFIFAIIGLLLVSSLDAAKQKGGKGKGKKAEKAVKEAKPVENKVQKDQKAVKAEKAKVEKVVKEEKVKEEPVDEQLEEEEPVVVEEEPVVVEAPKIVRPKKLKVLTAYDKCKLDCQKIRDQQDLHSYATQLREELAAAEAALEAEAQAEEAVPANAA